MILTELYCVSFCSRRQLTAGEFRNQVSIPYGMVLQGPQMGRCIDSRIDASSSCTSNRQTTSAPIAGSCPSQRRRAFMRGPSSRSTVCWIDSRWSQPHDSQNSDDISRTDVHGHDREGRPARGAEAQWPQQCFDAHVREKPRPADRAGLLGDLSRRSCAAATRSG